MNVFSGCWESAFRKHFPKRMLDTSINDGFKATPSFGKQERWNVLRDRWILSNKLLLLVNKYVIINRYTVFISMYLLSYGKRERWSVMGDR